MERDLGFKGSGLRMKRDLGFNQCSLHRVQMVSLCNASLNSFVGEREALKELLGEVWTTARGKRLCWDFNLAKGCDLAKPGQACPKGLHLCAEPGCQKPHSLTQEPSLPPPGHRFDGQRADALLTLEICSGSGTPQP